MINKAHKTFNVAYWSKRWADGRTNWDLGEAAPAIIQYFKDFQPQTIQILIPGCGNAYEAEALYKMGFTNITLVELVPEKAEELRVKFKDTTIKVVNEDFFIHEGHYDYIIEHTFFCSFPVNLRNAYAQKMCQLLKDGGKLIGLLFNRSFNKDEPPYGGDIETYTKIFEPYFSEILISECTNSVAPRAGKEVFIKLQK